MTDENGYFLIDKQGNSRTLSFDKLSNIDIDYLESRSKNMKGDVKLA